MKKFKRSRRGGSVVFAIVMSFLSLLVTSLVWYVFYPMVSSVSTIVRGTVTFSANAGLFADLLDNVWTWLGVIMLFNILIWAFAYSVKRDWESQYV